MLDLKLKDIPETVYKAIKALNDIKFGYSNHSWSGWQIND